MFSYDESAFRAIFESAPDAALTLDDAGRIVDSNPAAARLFGCSHDELLKRDVVAMLMSLPEDGSVRAARPFDSVAAVIEAARAGQRFSVERKGGVRVPVEMSLSDFVLAGRRFHTGFLRDVSSHLRAAERLRHLASHDPETQLPNLRGMLAHSVNPDDMQTRIALFRVDSLRQLVSAYGRHNGALVLHELAVRVRQFLSPQEFVARIREDAFAIIFPSDAKERLRAVRNVLSRPIAIGAAAYPLAITIGLSGDRGTLNQRLNEAELACDRAASGGRIRLCEFSEAIRAASERERLVESRLREALHAGGLALALQPKICLRRQRIVGAEALARWNDPVLGAVSPAEFIPLAERLGLIGGITDWMLQAALREAAQATDPDFSVAVNFSALDFMQADAVGRVERALRTVAVPAQRLTIELTESVVAKDPELVRSKMQEIKSLGVSLSIDDFGTGYSSLSYLRMFPVDSLKIDQSFVRDIPDAEDASAIARTIVSLARVLKLETVAEGVETERQMAALGEMGVDVCQGYYFSRPLPPQQFMQLIRRPS